MGKKFWLLLLGGFGVLALTARKFGVKVFGAKPRAILSIYAPQHLPTGWESTLKDYDALSMRLLSPGLTGDVSMYYELGKRAGCSVHGWGYQYLDSKAQADKELGRLQKQIPKYGVVCYWLNAETEFWNSGDPVVYPKIIGLVEAADQAGRIAAPTVTGGHIKKGLDGKGRGEFWGYTFGPKGLLEAYKAAPFDWINYWHGAIPGRSTLLAGNSKNPSQSDQIALLQRGTSGVEFTG